MTKQNEKALERARIGRCLAMWLVLLMGLAVIKISTASASAPASQPVSPGQWADALAESRSVIMVMAWALLALGTSLLGIVGFVVKLLAGVISQNTAAMTRCRDRWRSVADEDRQ